MSAHSLGHEESHSSIYRPHNCWPSLVGGSGRGWRVRGMGQRCWNPDEARPHRPPPPASGGGGFQTGSQLD